MSEQKEWVDATFYAQVEPVLDYWKSSIDSAKVVTITQKKPDRPRGGVIVTKLTIRLPAAAFLPLSPEAVIVVPENLTDPHPVQVEAQDANADD